MDISSEDKAATERALAALDEMAKEWAAKVALSNMAAVIAVKGDRHQRASAIEALVKQAFVEGAYTCYFDAIDGKIPWLKPVQ